MYMKKTVLLVILFIFTSFIYSQNVQNVGRIVPISQKVQNQSWLNRITNVDFNYSILQSNFDWQTIKQEDSIRAMKKMPTRIGFSIPIDLNITNEIIPIEEDGYFIYRYKTFAEGAKKIGFVFDDFFLEPGDEIYIANEYGQFIGPINSDENKVSRMYSTIPLIGQEVTLIVFKKQNSLSATTLHLSEIVYIYFEENVDKDLGDAASCQVNINCSPEGNNWQVQKRGVARISFREGSSWYLCSGTLINNTANDGTPYFLTAHHCGGTASAADRNVWQFYFNYERPGCPNTGTPPNNVITGCTYKAGGGISGGSDFQLVLLSSSPSLSWNPYYNGWSRSTTASPSGVGIHHPSGDAKKISTYTQTLGTGTWSGGMSSAHWTVKWAQTTNGWGVTEGGSSGSPIFDNNKRVVGTLTGGSSDCNNQSTAIDYYGKFSKHWDANGTTNDKKLQPWLDPLGTNPTTLDGYDPNNPSGVNNPQNFTATAISQSQINLSWSLNSSNNPVLLVYNTTNTFGTPTNGTNYNVGQTIPGGGTVIYKGSNTSFSHTGLNAGTTYYYKIFSIATGNNYSSGLTAQATTWWQGAGFSLDFEACADWSTDFTPWTSYDGDAKNTYGSSDCDFTGEGTAFGFMAFNPSLAGCFSTHGGQRCGVSICPVDASESNDWIISPKIQMRNNGSISFWVYSPKPGTWGNETYDVLVSTTNNQPTSFTAIATAEVAPSTWTQKTYSLSAYNNQQIYVAIRHRATDKFMMMIDDIVIDTGTVTSITPTASFTYSPSNICQGSPVQFTNTSQNATSYSWSFPGGNPATSTQTNPIVSYATSGTYNVTLIAYNGTISDTVTQNILVNPLPNVSIFANPTSICNGGSSILTASGASTYSWSHSLGSGSSKTVTPSTTTTYTVTGTSAAGCTGTTTVSVTVNTLPAITASATPAAICIGGTSVLTASGASTYSWSHSLGSGSSKTVTPSATTTYTVTGTSAAGCTATTTVSVTVENQPSAGNVNASTTQLCQNQMLTLTLTGYTPNSNIQWQISTNGINWNDILGATSSNYNYTFTSAGIYYFRAKVSNSCSSVYSDQITITVNPLPTAGTASANNTTICQNNSILLTLSGYSSVTDIQWQISTDNVSWSNILGANSAIYNYNTTIAGTIYIRAQVTNNCGTSTSNTITINVTAIPNGGTINTPTNTICQNDNIILTLTGQTPLTSLQWQISTDNNSWFNIQNANTNSYNFLGSNIGTYYFKVLVSNNCGISSSNIAIITVNPIPPTPSISLISSYPPILYSNATTGNQWYNLNGAIPGATNQTYQVLENGTYYVIVTENNCQSLPSNSITIDNVSINSYDNNLTVYPIPASDMIYIQTDKNISEIQLIDALGRVIISTIDYQLNVSNISNGVYQLLIKYENDRIILPVIIQK